MTSAARCTPTRVSNPFQRDTRKFRRLSRFFTDQDIRPTPAQVDEFVSCLSVGDPVADAVVDYFLSAEGRQRQARRLFQTILDQGRDAVGDIPEPIRAFFDQVERVPLWLDRGRVERAVQTMRRTGGFAELVLRDIALMGSYMAAAATKPLMFTGRLASDATPRRLTETASWWVKVTQPHGLERFGEGFKTTIRVRLMHAQVRHLLAHHQGWDYQAWGHPINQADMLATNLLFSQLFLLGLQALGFRFSSAERDSVMHLWRYAGYLMGVDERLLPASEGDAWRLSYLQYATQDRPDADSRALVQALSRVPLQRAGDNRLLQGLARLEIGYRSAFTRLLFGNRLGDELGLAKSPMVLAVLATTPVIFAAETVRRAIPGATPLLAKLGGWYYERMLAQELAASGGAADYQPVARLAR